jgi:hypothetical protein
MAAGSSAGRGLIACLLAVVLANNAHAGQIGRDADLLRTGWYPNQAGISPQAISHGDFGQLFSTEVTGQVYGQPLAFGGTLLVTTQANWIYGLDPVSGAIQWSRNVDAPVSSDDVGCSDILPLIGITATPVIDEATGIAYFTSKTYELGTSGPALWKMHAVAVATGAEEPGFPVTIQGTADNDPARTFSPTTQNQRPGLLLMNGVVYAAFGSVCDTDPFQGWVIGVSTVGSIISKWVDISSGSSSGAGIWMSGSALVSDGPGQILFVTGNGSGSGTLTVPTPGSSPPSDFGEAVVRLSVQGDGSLLPTDFFVPFNASSDYDPGDIDVGSGGLVGLPYPYFGTPAYRNLYVQVGKPGIVCLLDGASLGGFQQGPGGTDQVVQEIGPYGGVWSKPAAWGGDGGWVYIATADTVVSPDGDFGYLRAYRAGVDSLGVPTLTLAGSAPDLFGFSSSAPIVTSNGTSSSSALLWIIWNPDYTGFGAQLRAYDMLPVNGVLQMRFSADVGQGSKFNPPGVSENRLYVGTRDGRVIGFGLTASAASVANDPASSVRARLGAAYPNPVARATTMELALAKSAHVAITIFDPSGRRVRRLVDGDIAAGSSRVPWDGRNDAGAMVPNGLYLVQMNAAGIRQTRRVMIVR